MCLQTIVINRAAEAAPLTRGDQSDYDVALAFADFCHSLIAKLEQPQRLRDVGVERSLLPKLAANMLKSKSVNDNPKPLESVEQAQQFFEAMW
ncbi:MAG: iron-containing alcohol dehydrogenase [Chloroflexales bacterium]|nr:iron-containing alcohol dehydrogenase [Chloroflexales bacterium]